jgi:hypothetical protein
MREEVIEEREERYYQSRGLEQCRECGAHVPASDLRQGECHWCRCSLCGGLMTFLLHFPKPAAIFTGMFFSPYKETDLICTECKTIHVWNEEINMYIRREP